MAKTRTNRMSRMATVTGTVALLVSAIGGVAGAAPASASVGPRADKPAAKAKYDWSKASYILTLRAGAVETYAFIPREVVQDAGYSYVDLLHDTGAPSGRCEAESGAYWLGTELEEGVLSYGASPPGDDGKATTGYQNPVRAHTVNPDLTPGKTATTMPTVTSPVGPTAVASCADDASGEAASSSFRPAPGIEFVASTSSGVVDKKTGVYTGTSRAYMQALTQAGDLATFTSLMQIRNEPDKEAVITYRLSFVDSGSESSTSNAAQNGFTISGNDIPASQFVQQFNDQTKAGSAALASLGPAGLQLLSPTVGQSTDGGRLAITAPVIAGHFGLAAREGTLGANQGLRFGSVTFSGVYGGM